MIFSDLVDTLRDKMIKSDLASKEVEFCTSSRTGLELLSIYEDEDEASGKSKVYIDIGTSEDTEERDKSIA